MDRWSRPTATLVGVLVVAFLARELAGLFGFAPPLALSWPPTRHPWTILTSVVVHDGVFHLATNAVGLLIFGLVLERRAAAARFYAFVLGGGALAGLTEVAVAQALGTGVTVLGASGAVFGLLGYLLASNPLTESVAGRITMTPRAKLLAVVAVAGAITWLTRGRDTALIAHFTGLALGLLAGRAHLLRPGRASGSPGDRS